MFNQTTVEIRKRTDFPASHSENLIDHKKGISWAAYLISHACKSLLYHYSVLSDFYCENAIHSIGFRLSWSCLQQQCPQQGGTDPEWNWLCRNCSIIKSLWQELSSKFLPYHLIVRLLLTGSFEEVEFGCFSIGDWWDFSDFLSKDLSDAKLKETK